MRVEEYLITSVEEFEALAPIWKELELGEDMTAFQSYDWNRLLIEEFFSNLYNRLLAKVKVYVAVKQDKPIMILPVIIQKATAKILWWGRKKGCYILGEGSFSDYLNFIYWDFDEQALNEIINKLPRPLSFNCIRSETDISKCFDKMNGVMHTTPSVYVELESSVEDYTAKLSKSVRQNLRTASNRMNKAELTYNLCVFDGKLDAQLAKELICMHDIRAKTKNKKHDRKGLHWISRWIRNKYKEYQNKHYNIVYSSMINNASGVTIVSYINDVPAGYMYGMKDHNAIRIMHNCFKEEYKFYSPMFKGAFDFICEEIQNNKYKVKQIDFTRGNEAYKFQLGGKELLLNNYFIE